MQAPGLKESVYLSYSIKSRSFIYLNALETFLPYADVDMCFTNEWIHIRPTIVQRVLDTIYCIKASGARLRLLQLAQNSYGIADDMIFYDFVTWRASDFARVSY